MMPLSPGREGHDHPGRAASTSENYLLMQLVSVIFFIFTFFIFGGWGEDAALWRALSEEIASEIEKKETKPHPDLKAFFLL